MAKIPPQRKSENLSLSLKLLSMISAGMLIGGLIVLMFSAGILYDYEDTVRLDNLPDVDVIACLAGAKGRIHAAGEIWLRYWKESQKRGKKLPVLFFSGVGNRADWTVVARQLQPEVLAVLPNKGAIIENFSSNTDENAKWMASYVRAKGWEHMLLVTSSYHMRRARFVIEQVLGPRVRIETYSVQTDPFVAGRWHRDIQGVQVTLYEFIKWIAYRMVWTP